MGNSNYISHVSDAVVLRQHSYVVSLQCRSTRCRFARPAMWLALRLCTQSIVCKQPNSRTPLFRQFDFLLTTVAVCIVSCQMSNHLLVMVCLLPKSLKVFERVSRGR